MIVVAPLHELDEAIARWRPSHIVSLASPGAEVAPLPSDVATLRMTFNDIVEAREGLTLATADDIDRLLAFGREWPAEQPLLIHCWAGVSRSPAAAYVIACAHSAIGREGALAQALRQAAPFATPNSHVVALADRRLGRGGAMARAVTGIGRGMETGLGKVFVLDEAAI